MRHKTARKTKTAFLRGRGDRALFAVIMGLILFGAIMIFSGSVPIATAQDKEPYYYFVRQVIFIIIGLVLFLFTYNFDYHHYPKIAIPLLLGSLFLLVLVLFTPTINETHRWLDVGFVTIQVSDITKLAMIVYLASWLSKPLAAKFTTNKLSNQILKEYFTSQLGPFLGILALVSILLILQPDLSITVIIGMICIAMYFLSNQNIFTSIGTLSIFVTMILSGIFAGIAAPYRLSRILTYGDFLIDGVNGLSEPFGRDYQLRQILIAVGTGRLTGQGFAQSKQKFSYLTETGFSDTIFAVYSEEFGFLGSIIMVGIFVWIMFAGFRIATNAKDKLGALLASGITIWLSIQALVHIAVNVGLIPLTGVPLPFVSYGGSALIMCMAAVGILLNVSRFSEAYD